MQRMKRGMFVGGFAVVSLVLLMASTAYACTYFQGTFTVTPTAAPASGGTWVEAWGCDNPASTLPISSDSHVTSSLGDAGSPGTTVTRGNTVDLATGNTGTTHPTGNICTFNDPATAVPDNVQLPNGIYDIILESQGYTTYGDNYGGGLPPCMFGRKTSNTTTVPSVPPTPQSVLGGSGPGLAQDSAVVYYKLGLVTVTSGAISASSGTYADPLTTGRFTIPSGSQANLGTMQAAICIQDHGSSDNSGSLADHGNQVPIALL